MFSASLRLCIITSQVLIGVRVAIATSLWEVQGMFGLEIDEPEVEVKALL